MQKIIAKSPSKNPWRGNLYQKFSRDISTKKMKKQFYQKMPEEKSLPNEIFAGTFSIIFCEETFATTLFLKGHLCQKLFEEKPAKQKSWGT